MNKIKLGKLHFMKHCTNELKLVFYTHNLFFFLIDSKALVFFSMDFTPHHRTQPLSTYYIKDTIYKALCLIKRILYTKFRMQIIIFSMKAFIADTLDLQFCALSPILNYLLLTHKCNITFFLIRDTLKTNSLTISSLIIFLSITTSKSSSPPFCDPSDSQTSLKEPCRRKTITEFRSP